MRERGRARRPADPSVYPGSKGAGLLANFGELRQCEVQLRRIPILGTSVNRGEREGPERSNSDPMTVCR
jgi:hypothetical protein